MTRLRVLIADDSPDDRFVVRRYLERDKARDYTLIEATSGPDALEAAERERPDLVIIDQHLGTMSGVELLGQIREAGLEAIAVVFLAGSKMGLTEQELFARGADDFVHKDEISERHLQRVVTNALAKAKLRVELERSRRALREQLEFEARLIGVVSHDLRTPLNAVRLAVDTLDLEELSTPGRRALEILDRSGTRMHRMVDQLLDLTTVRRAEGFPIELEDGVDVFRLVEQAVRELDPERAERVRLDLDGDAVGRFDPSAMAQVLTNLLVNALRYGDEARGVEIVGRGNQSEVSVAVTNGGAPIPPEVLARLFEAFERGDGGRRSSDGLGLGLYIVRAIVDAHGGRIDASSDESQTRFALTFPRARPGGAAAL